MIAPTVQLLLGDCLARMAEIADGRGSVRQSLKTGIFNSTRKFMSTTIQQKAPISFPELKDGRLINFIYIEPESKILEEIENELSKTGSERVEICLTFEVSELLDEIIVGHSNEDGLLSKEGRLLADALKKEIKIMLEKIDSLRYEI